MHYLPIIGAVVTLILGVFGLLAPRKAAALVGVTPLNRVGISEIRATYGGLFIGLGVTTLLLANKSVYSVAAACWLGAALARIISIFADNSHDKKNWGGVFLETSIGTLLLMGAV